MTDKELLEKAAKAAGLKNFRYCPEEADLHACIEYDDENDCTVVWMPHLDDGDALRLAVKLGMRVYIYNGGGDDYTCVATDELSFAKETIKVMHDGDSASATRRAITRAAAAMVK